MTLTEYISIYRKANTKDANFQLSQVRTLVANEYCKVRALSGSERVGDGRPEDYADYRFWIHRRGDIREGDIIVWQDTDFNIKMIYDDGEQSRYMYIDAQRGVAA